MFLKLMLILVGEFYNGGNMVIFLIMIGLMGMLFVLR